MGNYRALSLGIGPHEVRASKTGFKTQIRNRINLEVGQDAVVNLRLEVGEIAQEVTVSDEIPVVNTTTSSVSGIVGEREVKDLPLNGRSFDNLITLNPGRDQLRPEERQHQHQQRKHVFGGWAAADGQSGPAERHRIHRGEPARDHAGRGQRGPAGYRRGARIQCADRHLSAPNTGSDREGRSAW